MAFLATPVAPPHWGTTFGGFGAAVVANRGRATGDLVGASTASSVLSPTSAFSVAAASTFPVAATGTIARVQGMPRVRSLPVSSKSVMFLHGLDDLAAEAVARCQFPCLHLVLGKQSINEDVV